MRYLSEPPPTADLVVVGGGVVGAATAWHAARAGLNPLVVEARPALCTLTTPVAAGAFRLQFDNLEELTLVRESAELFLHFQEMTEQRRYDLGVRQQGYLWLTTDHAMATRQKDLAAQLHAWGQTDVEILSGDEARRRFPFVGPNVVQARFRAGDGFLDTKQLTFGLAEASGAGVVTDCRATGFGLSPDGSALVAVETTRGTITCGAAVVAGGPLSGLLAVTAGVHLPIVTVPRNKLVFPALPVVPPGAPMTIDEDTGAHWRPALEGAWLLFTDPTTPPQEPTDAVTPDPAFAFRVLEPSSPAAVARVVPFWRDVWEDGAAPWILQAGQYTVTPDHRPLIGPTGIEGLYVNTGYSGHGIMLSPAGGRAMADLLRGTTAPADNPFAVDRAFADRPPPTL
ncbi:MAG TPA: FAD-dependent oxidoreductase [Actinomycetota bacterium]|nr:FAD-dependent oxidoreductase [Actinomycetota bacterium]